MSSQCRKLEFFKVPIIFLGLVGFFPSNAIADRVAITSFGHSSLLIKGGGRSVLLNPFRAVGCAEGLREPRVRANVILASSELLDEGARIAQGIFLVNPGSYRVEKMKFEGFATPHDRLKGRRLGSATVWRWNQGGLNFAHLVGSVSQLSGEEKVLIGRPDILIIAVGGGLKGFSGEEAGQVVRDLNPKRVIPVHYLRSAPKRNCDLTGIQPFLDEMQGTEVKGINQTLFLSGKLSNQMVIYLMR